MSKFEQYKIVLKDIVNEARMFEYDLDDVYFKKIDSPEIQKGNIKAKVSVQNKTTAYELQFSLYTNLLYTRVVYFFLVIK